MPNDTPDWFGDAQAQLDRVQIAAGGADVIRTYTLRLATHAIAAIAVNDIGGNIGSGTMNVVGATSALNWVSLNANTPWDFAVIPSGADTQLQVTYHGDAARNLTFYLVEVPVSLVHILKQPPNTAYMVQGAGFGGANPFNVQTVGIPAPWQAPNNGNNVNANIAAAALLGVIPAPPGGQRIYLHEAVIAFDAAGPAGQVTLQDAASKVYFSMPCIQVGPHRYQPRGIPLPVNSGLNIFSDQALTIRGGFAYTYAP